MPTRRILITLSLLAHFLVPFPCLAADAPDAMRAAASWLSQQLHRTIEPAQILVFPETFALDGCTIIRQQVTPMGATSLSLRCPAHILPQLVLLKLPIAPSAPLPPPVVQAGSTLQADWRTDSMRASIQVVALDSGAAGAEIRVRVARTNRILRARILSAHNVAIIAAGA